MTQRVADDVLGRIAAQQHDLFRRIKEGTLDPRVVSQGLQTVIEGKASGNIVVISSAGLANGGIAFASALDTRLWLNDQRRFFREVYSKNLPKVKLPSVHPNFGWGGMMASFMSEQWLWDCGKERIGAWKYSDESLDKLIAKNDRDPKEDGAYVFFCRDRVEADEEHKDKSYNQIVAAGIRGMTLAEYENLFIWFHWKTGQLLDRSNWTLCTGSRYHGGSVPDGSSGDGGLDVRWARPDDACGHLRCREVVVR